MALLDELGSLASLWGSATSAWRDPELRSRPGGAVQYIWGAYQQAVGAGLMDPEPGAFAKMNRLVSAAARVARAEINLGNAIREVGLSGIDQGLSGRLWAPDIDAGDPLASPFEGNARVRILADVTIGGIPTTQWYTWHPGLQMPQTVQGLLDALDTTLAGFGEDYQLDDISLGSTISITTY